MFKPNARLLSLILLLAFILIAWLITARDASPRAHAQSSTLYSTLFAQNFDSLNTMNTRLTYYNLSGSIALTTTHTAAPYRSIMLNQPNQPGLAPTFAGAGLFEADRPFGLVIREYNDTVGALGTNFRTDSFIGATAPANENVFPQLLKNIYDAGTGLTFNSRLTIQNANSAASATVSITYTTSAGAAYSRTGIIIAPGGSYAIDLQNDSALANVATFFGVGRVTANQPIAVVAQHNTAQSLMLYAGLATAHSSTTLYAPQLLKQIYDPGANYTWNTGVAVMSLDGTAANVTLTYKSSDGAITVSESQVAAPMASFDQRSSPALAGVSSFYGSGVITANKPVVATINVVSNYDAPRGIRHATYRAFSNAMGGAQMFLPSLWKNATDPATGVSWSTGVVGRLIGDSATTVTLTYYLANGATLTQSANISPSVPMFTFDQRSFAGLGDGNIVSGVLTTNPPQAIIAAVSFATGASTLGDACMYYEGIGQ